MDETKPRVTGIAYPVSLKRGRERFMSKLAKNAVYEAKIRMCSLIISAGIN